MTFDNVDWDSLPSHIQEIVLSKLISSTGESPSRDADRARGVDRAFRDMLAELAPRSLWQTNRFYRYEELMLLKPKPEPPCQLRPVRERRRDGARRHKMLQCRVTRTARDKEFLLELEDGDGNPVRPLLSARRVSRTELVLHIVDSSGNAIVQCCRLKSNWRVTQYRLTYDADFKRSSGFLDGQPTLIASIRYDASLHSIVRPRRMDVRLPDGAAMIPAEQPPTVQYCCAPSSCRSLHEVVSAPPSSASTVAASALPVRARQTDSFSERLWDLLRVHADTRADGTAARDTSRKRRAPLPMPEMGDVYLKSREPRWNERDRLWCLNFNGRVKTASVKNFQLGLTHWSVDGHGTASRRPSMQFGKLAPHEFALDFDPTVMTAMQAFAIALTAFDDKLWLGAISW